MKFVVLWLEPDLHGAAAVAVTTVTPAELARARSCLAEIGLGGVLTKIKVISDRILYIESMADVRDPLAPTDMGRLHRNCGCGCVLGWPTS